VTNTKAILDHTDFGTPRICPVSEPRLCPVSEPRALASGLPR
jgi:hypothetical protein